MRAVEWCAGAGGVTVGLHEAGVDTALLVESDPAACRTLSKVTGRPVSPSNMHAWAEGRQLGYPDDVGLWWASPPCQPFSPAGDQGGERDDRNLFPERLQLIDTYRPPWLICENVKGMTHKPHRDYAEWLFGEIDRRFAYMSWRILDAADYGVPQHRHRVFIVAGPAPIVWPEPTHSAAMLEADKAIGTYWDQPFDGTDRQRTPGKDGTVAHVTMREALGLGLDGLVLGGGSNPGRGRGKNSHRRTRQDLTDRPSTTIAAHNGGGAGNGCPFIIGQKPEWWHRGADPDCPCRAVGTRRNASVTLPEGRRRLTVEECARLQDFRPGHPFTGNKTSRYRQVGNAVPRRLARILAEAVLTAEGATT